MHRSVTTCAPPCAPASSRRTCPTLALPSTGRTEVPAAPKLLGRDAELGTLTGLLDEALAGEQRVALVCGDPGIGKTTLVEALEATARDRGFATVWGRCWEGGGGSPFWPW